jgi:hypothetical protein
MDKIILSPIALDELISQVRSVVKEELQTKRNEDLGEKFLAPAQVCKMFQPSISLVSLSAWTKAGRLTAHRMGSRVFYKYSEIVLAVTKLKKYKKVLP